MKILLTGHLGYIGSVMTPMLLAAGHDVTGCDSNLYERCTFDAGGKIAEVPWIRKDIRDIQRRDLKGFDAVLHNVHTAARAGHHAPSHVGSGPGH